MKSAPLFVFAVGLLFTACQSTRQLSVPNTFPSFFKEGHRGARGLMPENTIPAMKIAIEKGANVIEVDVYATKDRKVVVAHDPYVNTQYSQWMDGTSIPNEDAVKYIWYQMNYENIRKIDVGSKYYAAFPQQKKMVVTMPLLAELIDSVEAFTASNGLPPVIYNIELKTSIRYDSSRYNAPPEELVDMVLAIVNEKNIGNRFYLQSFDMRPLQYLHRKYKGVTIGFLTDNKNSLKENIQQLGFLPHIYSPHFRLVNDELIKECKTRKMKIIPWTVNDKEKIKALMAAGVDGIITDYPNYFSELGK